MSPRVAVFLAVAAIVPACKRDAPEPPVSTTTTTSANLNVVVVSNQESIAHLMEARCTRNAECRTTPGTPFVGGGASHEECLAQIGPSLKARLGTEACPLGMDGAALDRCLQNLRTQQCIDPLTVESIVEGIDSCRSAVLCLRVAPQQFQ